LKEIQWRDFVALIMSTISALLSELEDPFQMFPLQEVAGILGRSVDDAEDYIAQRSGWYGVSSKYRTVDEEHQLDVISLLIGSAFVLGQCAITQSVAIATKIHDMSGQPDWLPHTKSDIMNTEAVIHKDFGLSEMILFDAVANYFKHHRQWPVDWDLTRAQNPQRRTIEIVQKLGLSPTSSANLQTALHNLGFSATGIGSLADNIQSWREHLAENLRKRLNRHGTF